MFCTHQFKLQVGWCFTVFL
uniref:Uncharacterized protein n=1 Tax=Anguilla anguilla TaxID=7936 RepID=A0A0E9R1K6_ANGAN